MTGGRTMETLQIAHELAQRKLILLRLGQCGWSLGRTAAALDIYPKRLRRLIVKYQLEAQYRKLAPRPGPVSR